MAVFEPVIAENNQLADVTAQVNGRSIPLLGSCGPERELALASSFLARPNGLPVFLGAGLGHALRRVLKEYDGPVAIIDAEPALRQLTGLPQTLEADWPGRVTLIADDSPETAFSSLLNWRDKHGQKPLITIASVFYQRLRPEFYGELRKRVSALPQGDFWARAKTPRFINPKPRVLLLATKYFLICELERACEELELPHKLMRVGENAVNSQDFVKQFLQMALEFQPDCCITLNHMGVDMEGVLMDLLGRLELPLASWFVDNPHLIIHLYAKSVSPWATVFTWDEDNLPTLRAAGYEHVHYLPLATDPARFRPNAGKPEPQWRSRVSFVGNSMLYKVGARLKAMRFPAGLLRPFASAAKAFAASEDRSVAVFLQKDFPDLFKQFELLPDTDAKLAYETAITWKATQIYRAERVAKLIPFEPLLVGDRGWRVVFRHARPQPRYLDAISYYTQLPIFYGESEINFNCTSRQMKGAVNQRVFDAPAAGGFVLTDWRPQMEALFSKTEMACYHCLEEIPELTAFYLHNPKERHKITANARKRILACHTWARRLEALLRIMRDIYGTPKLEHV